MVISGCIRFYGGSGKEYLGTMDEKLKRVFIVRMSGVSKLGTFFRRPSSWRLMRMTVVFRGMYVPMPRPLLLGNPLVQFWVRSISGVASYGSGLEAQQTWEWRVESFGQRRHKGYSPP